MVSTLLYSTCNWLFGRGKQKRDDVVVLFQKLCITGRQYVGFKKKKQNTNEITTEKSHSNFGRSKIYISIEILGRDLFSVCIIL